MNDALKGVSILAVTVVAVGWMLNSDNDFEIAFLKNKPSAQQEALALQDAILQGDDPTSIQSPTAAGDSVKNMPDTGCIHGLVSSQKGSSLTLNSAHYVGVLHTDEHIYMRLTGKPIYLKMPRNDYREVYVQDAMPVSAASVLADIKDPVDECTEVHLTIGNVVTF